MGHQVRINGCRRRLHTADILILYGVIKANEQPIRVTKIVNPVSSVIKAENFVVNRILELTPTVINSMKKRI